MTAKEFIKSKLTSGVLVSKEELYRMFISEGNTGTSKNFYSVYHKVYPECDILNDGYAEEQIAIESITIDSEDPEIASLETELAVKERRIQRLLDTNTALRRTARNANRYCNTISTMLEAFLKQLPKANLKLEDKKKINPEIKRKWGIIFLSDIHANTKIVGNEVNNSNTYNFEVLSKRLEMLCNKSIEHFKNVGVTDVYVILGGDSLSSTKRNGEKLVQITSITNSAYLLVSLLGQFISRLNNNGFNVNVTGIVGNESRIGEDFEMDYLSATENYDWMILLMLNAIFMGTMVKVSIPKNPITEIVKLNLENENTFNILINHGYTTKAIEGGDSIVKACIDENIDLSLYGHYHHYVGFNGDCFYNGSLIGNNVYSVNRGFNSRASQNIGVISDKKDFYVIPIDLQDNWQKYDGFDYNRNIVDQSYLAKEWGYKGPEIILR